jgi:hypothetical protein
LKEESKGEKETEKEGKRTFPSVGRYTIPFLYDVIIKSAVQNQQNIKSCLPKVEIHFVKDTFHALLSQRKIISLYTTQMFH